jgi:hypothetical protein
LALELPSVLQMETAMSKQEKAPQKRTCKGASHGDVACYSAAVRNAVCGFAEFTSAIQSRLAPLRARSGHWLSLRTLFRIVALGISRLHSGTSDVS